jgi:drug/metabolite transporter (DMT)-like permease
MYFDSPKGIAILAYLAFLSAIAYAVWGMLLKFNPVSKVTVFNFTTPIFGVILVKLMMPEQSSVHIFNLILALVLVSLGVFLLNYNKQK